MPQRKSPDGVRFSPALFQFLDKLRENNDREWFQAHKDRYEREVKAPLLAFIGAFAEPLGGISRHYLADPRPQGGSMFRIYRDTRFARDKSPYKLNVGAYFRHTVGKDVHTPGFYLHLQPGESFASAGLWHPDPEALRKVRQAIVERARAWKALGARGIEVGGDALQRVPAGFDPGHPLAEHLKLKDFYCHQAFTDREVCAADFLERFAGACREGAPLVAFLAKALELPF